MTMERTTRWRWIVGVLVGLVCVLGVGGCDLEEPAKVVATPTVLEVWPTSIVDMLGARERLEACEELSYEEINRLMLEMVGNIEDINQIADDIEREKALREYSDRKIRLGFKLDKCRLMMSDGWFAEWYPEKDKENETKPASSRAYVYMIDPFNGAGKRLMNTAELQVRGIPDQQISEMKYGQHVQLSGELAFIGGVLFVEEPTISIVADEPIGTPVTADELKGLKITLERGPCYGPCPSYTLTIEGEGRVNFTGKQWTATKGNATGTITQAQLEELVREVRKADFFSLKDSYSSSITDAATYYLRIEMNGKNKLVHSYAVRPRRLELLMDRIDQIVNTKQWIGDGR